jgi:predicted DNA-binding protein
MRTSMSSERSRKKSKRARRPSEVQEDSSGGHTQVAVRFPNATVARADALAERMGQPGINVSRSAALRVALHRGLDAIAADKHGRKRPVEVAGEDAGQLQTVVRLSDKAVVRIDALAARISQPGFTISRSEALRLAILCGLDEIEKEVAG